MPDYKEIKKNIEEIKVDTLHKQEERKSFGAPQMNPGFMEKQEKKTVDEKQKVVPLRQINKLPIAEQAEQKQAEQKKNRDYEAFGVAFTLDKVNITAADSKYMKRLKSALSEYLKIRQSIFEAHQFASDIAEAENHFQDMSTDLIQDTNRVKLGKYYSLKDDERKILGDAYEVVRDAVKDYRMNHSRIFKFGRGKARYRQVRLIEEKLTMDNAKFFLSSERRGIIKSVDMKYEKGDSLRKNLMPTWHRAVVMNDAIDVHNQRYRNKRRSQKAEGKLPPWYKRALEWTGLGMMNNIRRLVMAYEGIGGLVDRSLGLATMLAANSLTLAGKIVKAPLKILSGIFNGASKYIFRSKKRWKVDYSLKKGWKSIDDGRRIFRKYMKGALVLPAAVTETFTRGIPYIFGHYFKSGVYKRTGKWSKAIYEDVKDVMKGIGFKDYGAPDRADADYAMAGGLKADKYGNVSMFEGTEDEDSLTIEDLDTEQISKDKNI